MTQPKQPPARPGGQDVFVVEPGQQGNSLLYRLLCLHPDVAYMSNLERRFPWLPLSATARLRLRRYSSKLHYWFEDRLETTRVSRLVSAAERLVPVPVDAEAICRRDRPVRAQAREAPPPLDARSVAEMREKFSRLRRVSQTRVLVTRLGGASRRLPVIDAVFPQARYLRVVEDGTEPETRRTAEGVARALARIPSSRVLNVAQSTLVAEPIEQMRRVLAFLGLERRRDYEWALKALKLEEVDREAQRVSSNGHHRPPVSERGDLLTPSEYAS